MTEAQKELFVKTKERLRRLGKENPADVIVALAEEIEQYRARIRAMDDELDLRCGIIRLLGREVANRDAMLEQRVEVVYDDFMRDYKIMREELEGAWEELTEARAELEKIEADTVRKMQERLKAEKFTHKNFGELLYVDDIDQIANELLEGEKDEGTTA